MDEKDKTLAGKLCDPHAPAPVALRQSARGLVEALGRTPIDAASKSRQLIGPLFGAVGRYADLASPFHSFHCDYGFNIRLGRLFLR